MPLEHYERPKGISFGVSRTFDVVARPWLETGRRKLKPADAELICLVCSFQEILSHSAFRDTAIRFSDLLRDHQAEVGELIQRVGKWRKKQETTKTGRARRVIEFAMTRYPGETLSLKLLRSVAEREKINDRDISAEYLRGRLAEIRREIEELTAASRKVTPQEIDAYLARKSIVQK
jgi:hypothetical protein